MKKTVFHYVYDPLCGWCYGAEPLVSAMTAVEGLKIELHGGGMLSRRAITPDFRMMAMTHDKRIHQLTGQTFGDPYFNNLLVNTDAILDSYQVIAAIMAVNALAGKGVEMLKAIQVAHYVEGRVVSSKSVLSELAERMGIEAELFDDYLQNQTQASLNQHIHSSRELMAQVGATGFPTFILEGSTGRLEKIDHTPYYGDAGGWAKVIRNKVEI